jgi:hypothetical protein
MCSKKNVDISPRAYRIMLDLFTLRLTVFKEE